MDERCELGMRGETAYVLGVNLGRVNQLRERAASKAATAPSSAAHHAWAVLVQVLGELLQCDAGGGCRMSRSIEVLERRASCFCGYDRPCLALFDEFHAVFRFITARMCQYLREAVSYACACGACAECVFCDMCTRVTLLCCVPHTGWAPSHHHRVS